MKKRLGLVLGRFQPLHYGHVVIMNKAFEENDEVVICIGSAQKSDPLTIEERHKRVESQLKELKKKNYRIVDLVDPNPIGIWPSYVKEVCKITDKTNNTLYRADRDLSDKDISELERVGFAVKFLERVSFPYRAPDGVYYTISSATDIKRIHKDLGMEDKL